MMHAKLSLLTPLGSLFRPLGQPARKAKALLREKTPAQLSRRRGLLPVIVSGILLSMAGSLAAEAPVWTDVQEQNGIAYLLRKSPSQIMRYDLDATEWLTPIPLADIPSAFVVDGHHFFIASGRKVERIHLDGSNKVHVANTAEDISSLLIDGNLLIIHRTESSRAYLTSLNKSTFATIHNWESWYPLAGATIAPSLKRIFGRSREGSPSDITWITYDDSGSFLAGGNSPYHGRYPGAIRIWLFPNETRVADSSGTVYNTVDLTYNNSFGATLTDLAFHGIDIPIALQTQELISYSNTLLETGRFTLIRAAQSLIVHGGKAFAFQEDDSPTKVSVEVVDLAKFRTQEPAEPISPEGLAYTIDDSAIDSDGVLYLLSKSFASVFRWDVENQEYLDTIALPEAADLIAYSRELNRLYLYAPSRKVYRIDLTGVSLTANHHATAPVNIAKMIPLGSDLMILQNGSWESQWIYGSDGELLKAHLSCCYDRYHFYNEGNGYLYYDSYRVAYLGNGEIGPREGAYISSFQPIALSHNGDLIVDSRGRIYDANGPTQIDTLSNNITRAVWNSANTLFTFKTEPATDSTMIQAWTEYFAVGEERRIPGKPLRVYAHGETVIVVTEIEGKPVFTPLTPDLKLIPPATLMTPELSIGRFSATAASLTWERVVGAETYLLERKLSTDEAWTGVATASFSDTRFTDLTLTAGYVYEYRLKAINGDLGSAYSEIVVVDLVGVVDERVDPREVAFVPDDVLISADDVLFLLSREHESIFAWDTVAQDWSATIPLDGPATRFTYSAENSALYTLHSDGSIYSIGLAAENPVEIFFAQIGNVTRPGLIAAGEFVIAGRGSSFDAAGTLVDERGLYYDFNDGVWHPVRRNIYHFRDGWSPNDLIATNVLSDGKIGLQKDSPYHTSTISWMHPVRVDPPGTVVITGSGRIFDAGSLEQVGALDSSIRDAVWMGGNLITLNDSVIYSHSPATYGATAEVTLPDTGLRLLTTQDGRLVSISRNSLSETIIDVYDANFDISPPASLAQPKWLLTAIEASNRIRLSWKDITGESGYQVERRPAGSETWEQVASTGSSVTTFRDSGVTAGSSYEYRVTPFNGDLEAEASDVLVVTVTPPGPPIDFIATTLDGFRIQLNWAAANLANGYRLERRPAGSTTWNFLQEVSAETRSFIDAALTPDTAYDYRFRAFNGLGSSEWISASAITEQVLPSMPLLGFPQVTAISVTLPWSSALYATEIVVERQLAGSNEWDEIAVVPSWPASFVDTTVASSTSYVYRIKSRNSAGDSGYSLSRTVTTPEVTPPPAPIFAAAPYPESATSLLLTWRPALYAEGYVLSYRLPGTDEWTLLGEFGRDVTSYLHAGLTTAQPYEYRLSAWNEVGSSPEVVRAGTPIALQALLHDDFEPQENYRMWYRISGGVAVDGGEGFDTGAALWFGGGISSAETMAADVRRGGYLHFSLRAGNAAEDGETHWRNFTSSQSVSVQYSTDGSDWATLQTLSLTFPNLPGWINTRITLPSGACSPTTRFRWITTSGSPVGNWAIDNVELRAPQPAPVPWVDYVQVSVLNSTTTHLSWPVPNPADVSTQVDPDGVYMFQVERRVGGGLWDPIGLVDGTLFPVFLDYAAPSDQTIFYRVRTLAPWAESLPSLVSTVSTVSQLSEWRLMNFGTTENAGSAADTAMDAYGIANLQRYAFGLEAGEPPRHYRSGAGEAGMPSIWFNPNTGKLNVRFMRRMAATNPEIDYVVEFSNDMLEWLPSSVAVQVVAMRGNWEEVRFEQPPEEGIADRGFVRVRIVRR